MKKYFTGPPITNVDVNIILIVKWLCKNKNTLEVIKNVYDVFEDDVFNGLSQLPTLDLPTLDLSALDLSALDLTTLLH